MKLRYLVFAFLIISSYSGFNQEWPKVYFPEQGSYPLSIIESYDFGYVIGGCSYPNPNSYARCGLIFKTDVNGEMLWYHSIGSITGNTLVRAIDQSNDCGLIIIGSTQLSQDQWAPFVLKLNKCGEKEWCHLYPSSNNMGNGLSIKTLPDSSFVALIHDYGDNIEEKRIWLFHLNVSGDIIWQKYYGQSDSLISYESASDMYVTKDSSIIVTGECYYPEPGQFEGLQRPFIIKTNFEGDLDWETPWTNNNLFFGSGSRSIADNRGRIYTSGIHVNANPLYSASPSIIFTDVEGCETGYKCLTPYSHYASAITLNWFQDSTIALGGGASVGGGSLKDIVFRLDTIGNIITSKTLYPGEHYFSDAQITNDNKLLLISGVNSNNQLTTSLLFKVNCNLDWDSINNLNYNYDTACPVSILNDTIYLDCDLVVNQDDLLRDEATKLLKIYPNPATDQITINLPHIIALNNRNSRIVTFYHKWEGASLIISDIAGNEKIRLFVNSASKQIELDTKNWKPGVYLIRMVYKNSIIEQAKFIKL